MKLPCIQCKGRDPSNCGRTFCPIIAKYQSQVRSTPKTAKKDYFGPAPTPFVGHYGYPKVNVGILSATEQVNDKDNLDNPRRWGKENTPFHELIDLRTSLVNANFKSNIKRPAKQVALAQEVAMARRPVEVEINLNKTPKPRLTSDPYSAPTGPNAKLEKVKLTENPKIPTKVEKVFDDTDLKAADAMKYLYKSNFDENYLTRILSIGTLGKKLNRRLVPTRWSITATDDIVCKDVIKELYDYKEIDYKAYFGSHLGNYFLILTMPGPWSYELFETYQPHASWNAFNEEPSCTTDYEGPFGRKDYVKETAGGYYASRLPIVEHLKKIKRNGSVIVLRVITGEYAVPMGVWVVREAARKAINSKPLVFSDEKLLLDFATMKLKKFFNIDPTAFFKKSILLKERKQPRLRNFF
ncbi:MAG: hypothetical protein ACE5FT_01365 [Candidatus Nanoarchaeia archaeon]